jgi:hypothetical protein
LDASAIINMVGPLDPKTPPPTHLLEFPMS